MIRPACLVLLALAGEHLTASPAEDPYLFRSDVALARVDAQVLDKSNRAILDLGVQDFVLRENGQQREIRNFIREELPVDFLLLLDVSGSMRPHVQRIATAAHEALKVIGEQDRVAIMVFDRSTRVSMPFRSGRAEIERGLEEVLEDEDFDGGTNITDALFDAARYIERHGRRDARRAIVILTDDQTERDRDEEGVLKALAKADAVLSALLAPDAFGHTPSVSQSVPNPSPAPQTLGGMLGEILLGRRSNRRYTRRYPMTGAHSAGTAEIAQRSGGDSLPVEEASSLETTLARLRQRYALYYYPPQETRDIGAGAVQVELADAARRRYPDAEVRFLRISQTVSAEEQKRLEGAPSAPQSVDESEKHKTRMEVNDRP